MVLEKRGAGLTAFLVLLLVVGGECDNVGAALQASSQRKLSVHELVTNAEALIQTGLKTRQASASLSDDEAYKASTMSLAFILLITGAAHFVMSLINAGMRAKQDYSLPIEHIDVIGNLEEETRYYMIVGWTVVVFLPVVVISVGVLTDKVSERNMVRGMLITLVVWQILYLMEQLINLAAFWNGKDEPTEIVASDDMKNEYDFVPPPQNWTVPGARSTTSIHAEPEAPRGGNVVMGGHTLYFDDLRDVGNHVRIANRIHGSASLPDFRAPGYDDYERGGRPLGASKSDEVLYNPNGRASNPAVYKPNGLDTDIPLPVQKVRRQKKTYGQALRPASTPF